MRNIIIVWYTGTRKTGTLGILEYWYTWKTGILVHLSGFLTQR